jgi:hypothetical protein
MGVDAIDQTICPSVLGMTKCSIAFGGSQGKQLSTNNSDLV